MFDPFFLVINKLYKRKSELAFSSLYLRSVASEIMSSIAYLKPFLMAHWSHLTQSYFIFIAYLFPHLAQLAGSFF